MKPITQEDLDNAVQTSQQLFAKYNVTEQDQDALFNALATIGVWNLVQSQKNNQPQQ